MIGLDVLSRRGAIIMCWSQVMDGKAFANGLRGRVLRWRAQEEQTPPLPAA